MSPDKQLPNRQSIRYKGYDYASAGAYFVTVCTKHRLPVLADEVLQSIVTDVWFALPRWFPTIQLDEFVIMPNHVHFVVWLGWEGNGRQHDGQTQRSTLRDDYVLPVCETPQMHPTLGDVVGAWKSLVTTVYLGWVKENAPGRRAQFWQRNYYDRIVRHELGLQAIRDYIRANPARWQEDPDNPENLPGLPQPRSADDYLDDVRRYHRHQKDITR